MKPAIRDKWVAALRSGEYEQTTGYLRRMNTSTFGGPDRRAGYCCLGVLCDLAVKEGAIPPGAENGEVMSYGSEGDEGGLPEEVREWAGLEDADPRLINPNRVEGPADHASSWNDDAGKTFEEIADMIEFTFKDDFAEANA